MTNYVLHVNYNNVISPSEDSKKLFDSDELKCILCNNHLIKNIDTFLNLVLENNDQLVVFKSLSQKITSEEKIIIDDNKYLKTNSLVKKIENNIYQISYYESFSYYCQNDFIWEQKYLNLLEDILKNGEYCHDRTNVGTLYTFGNYLKFDISKSFPLLTTKKVFFRGIVEELLFFLSGKTDAKILQNKNVHIWDGNSSREYLDSIGLEHFEEGDLGKFYGFQWRHWNTEYANCQTDYTGKGFDQIEHVIDLIKNNPNSRRIIISAWNPSDLNKVCLPPCHVLVQFDVNKTKRTLSCNMYQRSADMFLGVPFNIGSYALLTYLLALQCDLSPAKLRINFGNTHIYMNHIEQVYEQISRTPYNFPTLKINKKENLEDYLYEDFVLENYKSHRKLKGKMAV